MKIIDGLNLEGWQVEIPDCGRDDLPEFFKEMGFRVGAEIGVRKGDFSEVICKAGLKLYGIDPWRVYADYVDPYSQQKMDAAKAIVIARMKGYDFVPIQKTSMEAVKDFGDGSLDFVYIDGNHSFKYVVEDIWEWSKKVKKGGIISGHDYLYLSREPHALDVKYVLDAYTRASKLPKWYVLGRRFPPPGEKRDRERSWFWINP